MDNLLYILLICIVVPLTMMLFLLEKKSRLTVLFMIVGIFMCVFCAEVNGLLARLMGDDILYLTTTITPVVEEIAKALPVLYFAILISDKLETLISISLAVGIGFAILENAFVLVNSVNEITIGTALVRGFGSGLLHGICTATIGYGISFINKRKKLFRTGTFALLTTAIVYHAIYNMLVQSSYKFVGFLLPVCTYIPLVIIYVKKKKASDKVNNKSEVEG